MIRSKISLITKVRSNSREPAPVMRLLLSFMVLVNASTAPKLAFASWLSPHLERLENCTVRTTLSASAMKARSISSTLYVTRVHDDQESQTAKLFKDQGLDGEIAHRPVYPSDAEVSHSKSMLLTSVVYKREPSSLEQIISGSETQLYYEVTIDSERFAVNLNSFDSRPFEVCI